MLTNVRNKPNSLINKIKKNRKCYNKLAWPRKETTKTQMEFVVPQAILKIIKIVSLLIF